MKTRTTYDSDILNQTKALTELVESLLKVSLTRSILGEHKKAYDHALVALRLAEELKNPELLKACCKTLFSQAELIGDINKALEFHKKFKSYSDEVFTGQLRDKYRELLVSSGTQRMKREISAHENMSRELEKANSYLMKILTETESIPELLPICANCRKVQENSGAGNS